MLMPILALACELCPKNLEGTVYSLFMSSLNLGGILSGLFGSLITSALHITSTNFDNLSYLIMISNIIALVPVPFLFCISNSYFEGKETETLDEEKYAQLATTEEETNNQEKHSNEKYVDKNVDIKEPNIAIIYKS
jgi:MFS family permease